MPEQSRQEGFGLQPVKLPLTVTVKDGDGEVLLEETAMAVAVSAAGPGTFALEDGKLADKTRVVSMALGYKQHLVRVVAHLLSIVEQHGVSPEAVFGYYIGAIRHGLVVDIAELLANPAAIPDLPTNMGFPGGEQELN